jgi:integral membrane sensor domain MASE1
MPLLRGVVSGLVASMRRTPYLGQVSVVAAVYLLAAKLSLMLAIFPGYATPVWPPSGIALAAALVLGNRVWPGIWLGAALANLMVHASLSAAMLIGTGNTLEALAATFLIQRYIRVVPYRFERGEDVLKFVALVVASAAIAATIGVTSLAAVGVVAWSGYFTNWWTWLGGDAAGMIIVTPLILGWMLREAIRWSWRARLERFAFWFLLLAVEYMILVPEALGLRAFPRTYIVQPFILWATYRFKQREVAAAIAIVSVIAVGYTVAGHGPFVSTLLNVSLLSLLAFMSTVATTGLVVAAMAGERERAVEQLRKQRDELLAQVEAGTRELEHQRRIWERAPAGEALEPSLR